MRIYFIFFLCLILTKISAQNEKKLKPWGLHFGYSTQQIAPFNLPDYEFTQGHILGQLSLKKYAYKKVDIHFMAEGGYYHAQHKLINKWFTSTTYFDHFPDSFHQEMLQHKSIHQVVLHAGVEITHFLNPKTQLFGYAAIGPMWTSQQTERLASGFAFSDNFGMGVKFKLTKNTWLSNLLVIRHESNANLAFPNSGHNTLGMRVGVVFNLIAPQKDVMQPSSLSMP